MRWQQPYYTSKSVRTLWKYKAKGIFWEVSVYRDGYVAAGRDHPYIFNKYGKLLWTSKSGARSISINEDGYVVTSSFNNIYLFNRSGDRLWIYITGDYSSNYDDVFSISINEDGYIAAGCEDIHVYLLDVSGNLLWKYETGGSILSVAINEDGYIAAGSGYNHFTSYYDGGIYLFDIKGNLLWKYKTGAIVVSVAINEDGYIAAASWDGYFYFFDKSGNLLWKYRTTRKYRTMRFPECVSINQEGYVAAGSRDNNIYLFGPYYDEISNTYSEESDSYESDYGCGREAIIHTGDLEIIVLDSEGKRLEETEIFINGSYGGETDINGEFFIGDLEIKKIHIVNVKLEGYEEKEMKVEIEIDKTNTIEFRLEKIENTENMIFLLGIIISSLFLAIFIFFGLKNKSKEKFCPRCGRKIHENWKSCLYCGKILREE